MLPRQNFRRRHERRLPARFDHGRGGQERHQRLAGTDIAVQEPQHPVRLRQVRDDVAHRALLRRRERVGQRRNDLRPQQPFGRTAAAGAPALMPAQKRKRELAGEQFVISKPRPRFALRFKVRRLHRPMNPAQCVRKARKILLLEPRRILPFGQIGNPMQRHIQRLAELVRMQSLGHRIDRIDQRQRREALRVHHALGMQHLQVPIV